MSCRRWIVGLSLANAALLAFLSLYQVGILRRLPDPPLPLIDSNRVDAGRDAYARFWMPDGILGALAYLVTAALAAMGGKDRWSEGLWWVVLLLAAKILFEVYNAAKLTVISWAHYRAFCILLDGGVVHLRHATADRPRIVRSTAAPVRKNVIQQATGGFFVIPLRFGVLVANLLA
ncbi:MAG TPA: vitamin K epoxide reductase family protein [Roseiflexaceae bacterium]|jgi:hypothetical protein